MYLCLAFPLNKADTSCDVRITYGVNLGFGLMGKYSPWVDKMLTGDRSFLQGFFVYVGIQYNKFQIRQLENVQKGKWLDQF